MFKARVSSTIGGIIYAFLMDSGWIFPSYVSVFIIGNPYVRLPWPSAKQKCTSIVSPKQKLGISVAEQLVGLSQYLCKYEVTGEDQERLDSKKAAQFVQCATPLYVRKVRETGKRDTVHPWASFSFFWALVEIAQKDDAETATIAVERALTATRPTLEKALRTVG